MLVELGDKGFLSLPVSILVCAKDSPSSFNQCSPPGADLAWVDLEPASYLCCGLLTFYDFPKEHWGHLRTTNPVESPFAALRLRTDAAKRYKRVDRAIAVIWKMLMVAEQRFRRLKAPELIEDVYLGAQYADGIAIESTAEKVAA